ISDPLEKKQFQPPQIIRDLVAQGHVGDKVGKGFYCKQRTDSGYEIHELDLDTKHYKQTSKVTFTCLEQVAPILNLEEKLKKVVYAEDKGGQFIWHTLKRTLLYAASKLSEIADDVVAVDQAMKWGFNWKLGPFETWD